MEQIDAGASPRTGSYPGSQQVSTIINEQDEMRRSDSKKEREGNV